MKLWHNSQEVTFLGNTRCMLMDYGLPNMSTHHWLSEYFDCINFHCASKLYASWEVLIVLHRICNYLVFRKSASICTISVILPFCLDLYFTNLCCAVFGCTSILMYRCVLGVVKMHCAGFDNIISSYKLSTHSTQTYHCNNV